MTPAEALAGLAPIIGGGGMAGIVIAYLGYRAEVLKGRDERARRAAARTASGTDAGGQDLEPLTNAVALLTATLMRANVLAEFRMGTEGQAAFRAWLEERELRDLRDAFRRPTDSRPSGP